MNDELSIYICDNCGRENPPTVKPDSRITACCGYGLTGIWKDGWGKRTLLVGQENIDKWRGIRKSLITSGELSKPPWSRRGHYEI